jgi:hypothetical protein
MGAEDGQAHPGLVSVSIPAYMSADQASHRYLAVYGEAVAFPVRQHGAVSGIVRRERIERLSGPQRRIVTVGELAERFPTSA